MKAFESILNFSLNVFCMYIIIIISRSIFVDKKLRVCVCDEKQSKIISQKNNGNVQNANELLMRRRFFPLF